MDIIMGLIRKELLTMENEEIDYVKALWEAIIKMQDDFSKSELVELASLYIDVLSSKIENLEKLNGQQ